MSVEATMLQLIGMRTELDKFGVPFEPTSRNRAHDEAIEEMKRRGYVEHIDVAQLPWLAKEDPKTFRHDAWYHIYRVTPKGLAWWRHQRRA